jgi:UDP-glucose:tetrahydrobiopterin glucosyltransferase
MSFVSVITPAFRAETTIARTVLSVIAQTHPDWEMLIVSDDGQDYAAILRAQGVTDSRLRFGTTGKTGAGPGAARNIAVAMAQHPIISSLDADDAYSPDFLSQVIPAVEQYGACNCSLRLIDEITGEDMPIKGVPTEGMLLSLPHMMRYFATYANIVYDRRRTKAIWPEGIFYGEDLLFWLLLLDDIPAIIHLSKPQYRYYYRKGSLSHPAEAQTDTSVLCERREILLRWLDTQTIRNVENRDFLKRWFQTCNDIEHKFNYTLVEPEVHLAEMRKRFEILFPKGKNMRILLAASAVGAIGDGLTGGVTDVMRITAGQLLARGHSVDIMAAQGSDYDGKARLIGLPGQYQPTIVSANAQTCYPIIADSLLSHYWRYAFAQQAAYDVILNLCQDWLPYYLTPFFTIPVMHLANVGDTNAVVTAQLREVARTYPGYVAALSNAQARELGIENDAFISGLGIDMMQYPFSEKAEENTLIWCARIAPEKGLEDAAEIARCAGKKLLVCGFMQDEEYFAGIMANYVDVIDYQGFLNKEALVAQMGRAEAILCTHKWTEAFGLVVIEALACGTPVISYDRGSPAEIIEHGRSGFVVPAGGIEQSVQAVEKIATLKREECRRACSEKYSAAAYGERIEKWIIGAQSTRSDPFSNQA